MTATIKVNGDQKDHGEDEAEEKMTHAGVLYGGGKERDEDIQHGKLVSTSESRSRQLPLMETINMARSGIQNLEPKRPGSRFDIPSGEINQLAPLNGETLFSSPDDVDQLLQCKDRHRFEATNGQSTKTSILKLPVERLHEMASPVSPVSPTSNRLPCLEFQESTPSTLAKSLINEKPKGHSATIGLGHGRKRSESEVLPSLSKSPVLQASPISPKEQNPLIKRTSISSRASSTPVLRRKHSTSASKPSDQPTTPFHSRSKPLPVPFELEDIKSATARDEESSETYLPMPPYSIPAFLQLELSSQRPSPMYIYRPATRDIPYEPTHVKMERLLNFFWLPLQLEQVLWFGAFACLDAWLYNFTILPLRFTKACGILGQAWIVNLAMECSSLATLMDKRLWRRQRQRQTPAKETSTDQPTPSKPSLTESIPDHIAEPIRGSEYSGIAEKPVQSFPDRGRRRSQASQSHQRPLPAIPSVLTPNEKADLLKGLLILISCVLLLYFDASQMYHSIRRQAAIKLYVIYNVLEVFDRLLSALGQDVLECLFSKETLEQKAMGSSKMAGLGLFLLALAYTILHSIALFYQVITLNVAVNSYSNALLTLLMSNQFVEIKSTVFKRIEKENLFQLTCADIVERFELWLMLIIIAARNIVESLDGSGEGMGGSQQAASIFPSNFTWMPAWAHQLLSPFILVLGTEMLVDWLKHAYITKFNNTKPNIYGRFLDVLAKDYYTDAFSEQTLTRRIGLAVIPLSCLFIRASVQTYHMFLATALPLPLPSPATSLSVDTDGAVSPPTTTAALYHLDTLLRHALGRTTYVRPLSTSSTNDTYTSSSSITALLTLFSTNLLTPDALLSSLTTLLAFLLLFLVLLALKLALGMALLSFARRRYATMQHRQHRDGFPTSHADGRRNGGWGVTEVGDEARRWIYDDDADGARRLRERERLAMEKLAREERDGNGSGNGSGKGFGAVERYSMVAKRIW